MAIISPSTFDALNNYVGMRLQQGVPIVDADWNEMDDIRRFELRAFLKWFVGDGIPGSSTAFRIEPLAAPAANNFRISGGTTGAADPLANMGRALVDGQEVRLPATIEFRDQPLHASRGAAATDLATRLGVPVIPELVPVAAQELHNVYLDVWERLVTPAQQPALVLPGVGTESCARLRRESVVRVRRAPAATIPPAPPASPIPAPGDADYQPGHSYLLLAQITRRPTPLTAADIRDDRRTGLSLRAQGERLDTLERLLLLPAFNTPPGEFSPVAGRAGVQVVTLNGRNFAVGTPTVQFGGTSAPVTSFTATQIIVTVPAGLAVGPVPIRITTAGGAVTSTNPFNVIP